MDFWGTKQTIEESLGNLYNNQFISDVKFTFSEDTEERHTFAHSWVLSIRSSVFYEKFKDSFGIKKIIQVSESYEIFNEFLKFLYTDSCNLNDKNALQILNLSQIYSVDLLESKILDYLDNELSHDNILSIYDYCNFGDKTKYHQIIEENFNEISKTDLFINIKPETLENILKLDLHCIERDVFSAVIKWSENQCNSNNLELNGKNKRNMLSNLIYLVKFPTMSLEDFTKCIKDEPELLTSEEISRIFQHITGICARTIEFSSSRRHFNDENECNILSFTKDLHQYDPITIEFPTSLKTKEYYTENKEFTTKFSSSKRIAIVGIKVHYIGELFSLPCQYKNECTFNIKDSVKNSPQNIDVNEIDERGYHKIKTPFIIEPDFEYTITNQYKNSGKMYAYVRGKGVIQLPNDLNIKIDHSDTIGWIDIKYS